MLIGIYKFQLILSPVAISLFQWFLVPSILFWFCFWQRGNVQQRAQTQANVTTTNLTSSDLSITNVAAYSRLALEVLSIFFTPLVLGRIFNGQKKFSGSESYFHFPKFIWILVLAMTSQLAAYAINITSLAIQLLRHSNTTYLFVLPYALHWTNYLFLRYSALLLAGSLMDKVTQECKKANGTSIISKAKSCLKAHYLLSGPLFLVLMSIDSLFLMVDSFMSYMAWTYSFYMFMFIYLFLFLNEMFALIYTCITCDKYLSAVNGLLVPLRCSN